MLSPTPFPDRSTSGASSRGRAGEAALSDEHLVAGQRKHRGLEGRTPAEVFDQAESGTLTLLTAPAFTLAEWSRAKAAPDVHVKCGKALHSVPWKLIGQLVDIRATATMVQIFHHGELVKTHVRKD
ncbi:hypothetical protein WEI85_05980 [Actinomycetes bacterium KLBMP 9797]